MLKPLEYILQFQKEKRDRDKKSLESFYSYSDSLITWIIGFCITALSLIVSNYKSILENLHGSPKPIVVLLLLASLAGLIYRMIAYTVLKMDRNLDNYLIAVYGEQTMVPITVDEDADNWTLEQVVALLQDDFNITPAVNPDPEHRDRERDRLLNHYKEWCHHYGREFDIAINLVIDVDRKAYKIPETVSRQAFEREKLNPSMGYDARLWAKLTTGAYWITVLCFATAVTWVSIFLLRQ